MDIDHLKEFVVLAQTGNFLEAAEILYSSQSTLSKHIKSMEMDLGVPLFNRTTRKVSVSKFGLLLLPYARQITEIADKFTAILKSNREINREILNLGSMYGLAQYKITDVLVNFKKSLPGATLNVLQASSRDLTEMLRQGKCELAFVRDIEDAGGDFVQIPFTTDTIVAVLPIKHHLAKQKMIPLKMLENENFMMAVEGTMPFRLSMKACELSGFEPRIVYSDPELENQIDLVTKGMGVTLALKKLALYHNNPKAAIVDITPIVETYINLCYLKTTELTNAAKQLVVCAGSQ
jgi:LysR family transcriptional regulator, transcription activator of glutamate synthase operon